MKIAAVTDSYHPTSDGVVVAVDTYTKALKTVGIESEIVAPDPGDEKEGSKVYAISGRSDSKVIPVISYPYSRPTRSRSSGRSTLMWSTSTG